MSAALIGIVGVVVAFAWLRLAIGKAMQFRALPNLAVRGLAALLIADDFLELEIIEVDNDVRRQISVKRFAGMGEQVGDTIGYSVRSGTSIVIESRSVA